MSKLTAGVGDGSHRAEFEAVLSGTPLRLNILPHLSTSQLNGYGSGAPDRCRLAAEHEYGASDAQGHAGKGRRVPAQSLEERGQHDGDNGNGGDDGGNDPDLPLCDKPELAENNLIQSPDFFTIERELSLQFIGEAPTEEVWTELVQALLMSNEFAFVD